MTNGPIVKDVAAACAVSAMTVSRAFWTAERTCAPSLRFGQSTAARGI